MRLSTLSSHRARINRVTAHLTAQLDAPVEMAKLARQAGLSPRQFERVFTRAHGESPRALVRRLRLERAAIRLRATTTRILAIAIEAGFESHEAFTRVFQRRFGHTPQSYRRLTRVTTQPRPRTLVWQRVAAAARRHVEEHSSVERITL
jgi:AraC family transcriptional regulator